MLKNNSLYTKPQIVFLIIGLIYGLGFVFINPPLFPGDESEHFEKALYLSDGHIIPEVYDHHAGVFIPENTNNLKVNLLVYYNNL